MRLSHMPFAAAVACVSGVASAQPSLVATGLGYPTKALSADGLSVVGASFNYPLAEYQMRRFTLGTGFALLDGGYYESDSIDCSDDAGVVVMGAGNYSNWGGINCFNGLNPPLTEPCPVRNMAHRYDSVGGWQNIGGFQNIEIPVGSGQFFSQTRCDFIVNPVRAVSGNGRYVVGYGYLDTTAPFGGICGKFHAYRYDSQTGVFAALPRLAGSELSADTRVADVNADGTVMVGSYDSNVCVWTANGGPDVNGYADATLTVLGAGGREIVVNRPGDVIASASGTQLKRWADNAGTWVPQDIPPPVSYVNGQGATFVVVAMVPIDISDDGNTIVGLAAYNTTPTLFQAFYRGFIWRPSLNGGVPIDLEAYVASIDSVSDPILVPGTNIGQVHAISADGNAILMDYADRRNTCPTQEGQVLPISHVTTGLGVLYLNGVTCEPPRIALSPFDHVQTSQSNLGVSLNVFASGSWPLTYQWQKEDSDNPGTWANVDESCAGFDSNLLWAYEGTTKSQLRVGTFEGGADRAGNYRCIVSNDCGSIVSEPANVSFVVGACCIPGNACYIEYESRCATAGGVWGGTESNCDVDPCAVVPCCLPGQICLDTTALDCAAQGGTAGPENQSCFFYVCPGFCDADWCQDGSVGVPDIFCFLADWFAGDPTATNYGGTSGVPAIFAFLAEWFATPQGACTP